MKRSGILEKRSFTLQELLLFSEVSRVLDKILNLIQISIPLLIAWMEVRATKDRRRSERRAALRAEESRLSMQFMDATCQLAEVSANALAGGHNNGNVEDAKEAASKAKAEYYEFLKKTSAETMYK